MWELQISQDMWQLDNINVFPHFWDDGYTSVLGLHMLFYAFSIQNTELFEHHRIRVVKAVKMRLSDLRHCFSIYTFPRHPRMVVAESIDLKNVSNQQTWNIGITGIFQWDNNSKHTLKQVLD